MEVSIDAIGNLHGRYPGSDLRRGHLLIGSHLDTVPNAGAYDGVLGVVLGITLIESLKGARMPLGIEIVGFSEEEGVRFGVPFLGSRALVGGFDMSLLEITDGAGISLRDAIVEFGLNPAEIGQAAMRDAFAYVEFHIEQGPLLDSLDRPLAAVECIAGQSRFSVRFTGTANHAGTTPMHLRRDALAGTAEWVSRVEQEARSVPDLVATVGSVNVTPGASNVIAESATATLDVRHAEDDVRTASATRLLEDGKRLADERKLGFDVRVDLDQTTVQMDDALTRRLELAMAQAGAPVHRMPSGAGHDAMIVAPKIPSAMLFLRSPGGVSHHPDETVRLEDVALALDVGEYFLRDLAEYR